MKVLHQMLGRKRGGNNRRKAAENCRRGLEYVWSQRDLECRACLGVGDLENYLHNYSVGLTLKVPVQGVLLAQEWRDLWKDSVWCKAEFSDLWST